MGRSLVWLVLIGLLGTVSGIARSGDGAAAVVARTAELEGGRVHYLTAGQGPPLILLHGYTQTSRMWRPIIPELAKRYTVIAPDLPGIGDSDVPPGMTPGATIDMKSAAVQIHALARALGITHARVVGHDIGLMVAYAYAAQFPDEVDKLVLMDAFVPGLSGWQAVYDDPSIWHFRFHGPAPEALVKGRERVFLDSLWDGFAADKARSVPEDDRRVYTAAYARPGRMRAGWAYFASFPQSAKELAELSKTKLGMPVLTLGGEKAFGELLGEQLRGAAEHVTVVVLKGCGHWLLEERPKETTEALVGFLK